MNKLKDRLYSLLSSKENESLDIIGVLNELDIPFTVLAYIVANDTDKRFLIKGDRVLLDR